MNREILFRGKRVDGKGWVYGDLIHDGFDGTSKTLPIGIAKKGCYPIDVMPATIGQFTGLTDKGGVKIFEGDVLSIEIVDEDSVLGSSDFYTGAVIYGRDYKSTNKGKVTSYPCSFTIHCKDWYMEEGLLGMNDHDVEIIGNIHDNPELIK